MTISKNNVSTVLLLIASVASNPRCSVMYSQKIVMLIRYCMYTVLGMAVFLVPLQQVCGLRVAAYNGTEYCGFWRDNK